jgi:PII-like signaling protein
VRTCKVDGRRLTGPHERPGTDDAGLKTWVKLMVHADHDTLHAGRPLFFEIVRRHVPATTIVVDTPERIAGWFSIIDELTDQGGVVTSELVPAFHARGTWGEAGGLALANRARAR